MQRLTKIQLTAKILNRWLLPAGCLLVSAISYNAFADTAAIPQMQRTPLLEKSVGLPQKNIKAKVIRVNFPVGFKTPWHTHDGPGPRYVVKGTLKVSEGSDENSYAAGQVFWETGGKMMVENIGQEPAELIIFEMAPDIP